MTSILFIRNFSRLKVIILNKFWKTIVAFENVFRIWYGWVKYIFQSANKLKCLISLATHQTFISTKVCSSFVACSERFHLSQNLHHGHTMLVSPQRSYHCLSTAWFVLNPVNLRIPSRLYRWQVKWSFDVD